MPNSRIRRLIIFVLVSCLMAVSGALAQNYSTKDAQYVTNSRNSAVLRYIVCLELVAGSLPSSMNARNKIKRGEADCRSAAARLPKSSREPDAADISAMILECGFRPGEGSPGFDCGDDSSIDSGPVNQGPSLPGITRPRPNGPRTPTPTVAPIVADEVDLDPRRIELGKWIEGFALDGNNLWVAESGQRTLAKVNFRNGKVEKRFKVGRLPIDTVVVGRDTYTLVATDKILLKHSRSGRKSRLAKLSDCPETMIASGTDIFVLGLPACSSESSRLTRVSTRSGSKKASPDLGEWAMAATATGKNIWVGHARYDAISIVDKARLTVQKMAIPGIEVWALASNSRSVFAGGRYESTDDDGNIVMIDARNRKEISRYSVTERVAEITANEAFVVAVGDKGTIWVFSAKDLSIIRTIRSATGTYEPRLVRIVGNDLIVSSSNYRGENGAILVFSDYLPKGLRNANPTPQRPSTRPTRPTRPSNPTAIPTRPTVPTTRPTRPTRPTGVRPQAGFPVVAGTYGGRVRNQPNLTGTQIASTLDGDDITLIRRTNSMYKGFPWFSIRLNNGQTGYQWGGIICSYSKPMTGTVDVCQQRSPTPANNNGNQKPSLPTNPRGNNGKVSGADIFVGVLDLFGKIIENENKPNNNSNNSVIRENLNANASSGPVSIARDLNNGQLAIYTIRGNRGQNLKVEAWSQSQNTAFEIYIGKAVNGGTTLPGAGDGDNATYFDGKLPRNGQYQIVVGTPQGGRSSFQLTVELKDAATGYIANNSAAVSNSRLVVGTYTSKSATSGNIQYDEASNRLTWTEFCGPTIELKANWGRSRLRPTGSNLQPFRLTVRNGTIRGFKSGGNTYKKENGIMMPGCAPAPQSQNLWTDKPQDARINKDYSSVPNAHWATCEAANNDPNSPSFNNETAYWNCADAGMQKKKKNGSKKPDPRSANDYAHVSQPRRAACDKLKNKPTRYYDCMDQALMDSLEELEDGVDTAGDWTLNPQDPRSSSPDYKLLPNHMLEKCSAANLDPNSPNYNNEKAYWDCADDGLQHFYASNATKPQAPAADPRENKDYSILPMGYLTTCARDHGENSSPYFDCLDSGLVTEAANQRVESEFPDITAQEVQGCTTYGYGSDDFFGCLLAVRQNKAQTGNNGNQLNPENNNKAIMQELNKYCSENYAAADVAQCKTVLTQCVNAYPDHESKEFDQCTENSGW